jgi:glutamate--cysteine ligase
MRLREPLQEVTMGIDVIDADLVSDREAAEHYIARVCFKTGPPTWLGAELEWTVHHRDDPARPLDPDLLADLLGDHAPPSLHPGSPHTPLPQGGLVTVEPGGQVEISAPPRESLAALVAAIMSDIRCLSDLLGAAGLVLGEAGRDPFRTGTRILDTPRYAAMEHAYDRTGTHGRVMMTATASVQVCLDIGVEDRATTRWRAVHAIGPALLAAFANSPGTNGAGWASERMRTWFGVDPTLLRSPPDDDPATAWARHALDSPLLCVRRPAGGWEAPPDVTFADWIAGDRPELPDPPTYDDLGYHLSTLFPLVRPRGYLEVRYLDAQPGDDWLVPVALVAALFADERTVDAAVDLAGPVEDRWLQAARDGLADPELARTTPALLDLACRSLTGTDLDPETISAVTDAVGRRLHRGVKR